MDYIGVMVKEAKDETGGRAVALASVGVVSCSPDLREHVLKHYPLNKLRPIKIRPVGKGKAV